MNTKKYYQLPKKLFTDFQLSPVEIHTFMYLNDLRRVNNDYSSVSIKTLCNTMKVHKRHMINTLKRLESLELVKIKRDEHRQAVNSYLTVDLGKHYFKYYKDLLSFDDMSMIEKLFYVVLSDMKDNVNKSLKAKGYRVVEFIKTSTADLKQYFNLSLQEIRNILNSLISKKVVQIKEKVNKYRSYRQLKIQSADFINSNADDRYYNHSNVVEVQEMQQQIIAKKHGNTFDTAETVIEKAVSKVNETVETVKENIKHSADKLNENISSSVSAVVNSSCDSKFFEMILNANGKTLKQFKKEKAEKEQQQGNKFLDGIKWS